MISVCIATLNGERYIREQLLSIIPQLSAEDEIILSDDGSTDGTLDVVRSLDSSLIKIVKNPKASSYTSNFENALSYAKGDIVFLSDQDDIWFPDKVSCCVNQLSSCDFVVHNATFVDSDMNELGKTFYEVRRPYKSFAGNLFKFGYIGCCFAFKRSVLDRALPFPENKYYCTHDNWLFLVAKGFYSVKILSAPMIYYRRHNANASMGAENARKSSYYRCRYRIYLLLHLAGLTLKKRR